MNPRSFILPALLAFTVSRSLQAAGQPAITLQVTETSLGKWDPGGMKDTLAISPDGRHVAYAAQHGTKFVVLRDGKEGKIYDGYGSTGSFGEGMKPLFSQDSRRLAYSAKQGNQWAVVIDGHEGAFYDDISNDDIALSPDGKGDIVVAKRNRVQFTVKNGLEGKAYSWIRLGPTLSADGKHLAYLAEQDGLQFSQPATYCVVLDEKEGKKYQGPDLGHDGADFISMLTFSPDGRHLAYLALINQQWLCVEDGIEGKPYDNIVDLTLAFSPDSQKLTYSAQIERKWHLVVNGVEGPAVDGSKYLGVGFVEFSPNGKRIAYWAENGHDHFVIVDGKKGENYLDAAGFQFSPDSNHFTFLGKDGTQWVLIVDGVESKRFEYDEIRLGPRFSPDGQIIAFCAERGKKFFMVVNGVEGRPYDKFFSYPNSQAFSPDSKHMAYIAQNGDHDVLVVDEVESSARFTEFPRDSEIVYDSPTKLHIITQRLPGPEFFLTEVEIKDTAK